MNDPYLEPVIIDLNATPSNDPRFLCDMSDSIASELM